MYFNDKKWAISKESHIYLPPPIFPNQLGRSEFLIQMFNI